MDCNKDEALRAKRIAEKRMQTGDFVGALKVATKAKRLFPEIPNIAQVLTVCEVHCAAQNKLSGSEMDWYGILQTERLADRVSIKRQYRKLALLLHPDKNKCPGAEAAFKLIEEANRFLSDQTKCSACDLRISGPVGTTLPEVLFHDPSRKPSQQYEQQTFWTSCRHCKARYQYYKTIMNATIRCQQCSKSFKARDLGYQGTSPGYTWPSSDNHKQTPKRVAPKEAPKCNGGKCTAGVYVSHEVEKSKGGHVSAGLTKASVGTSNPVTSKAKGPQTLKTIRSKRARQSVSDLRDDRKAENVNGVKGTNVQENSVDPSGLDAGVQHRKSSKKKQHVSCTETAEGGVSQSSSKRSRRHESFNISEVGRKEVPASGGLFNSSSPASFTAAVAGQNGEMRTKVTKLPPNFEIWCPYPDFSDFEKDRAEDCFAANQFWAIFDDIDSMPRFYALVQKVYSPFKLKITWLDVDSDDQGEIDWHYAGLPVACGKYKLGQSQITTDHAMFSHQIHCIKGSNRGSYLVYPKKRETWAIFRDWDIGWSSNPEKHSEYQYEYVVVRSDFDKNIGIRVSYLGKVEGFVSLFQKTGQNGCRSFCIPPNKLYRFSHRIPSYKMAGNEREGVPRKSFELDPAGLPSSLFKVGDSGDTGMEYGVLNNGDSASIHKSSMSNEGTHKAKLPESNSAGRVSPILSKSPRSNVKSLSNGQAIPSQYMSKCTPGVGVSHKVEQSKGGHVSAGLTKASVGTSNPCTSKVKESQTLKNENVGSKRARQSASDLRDNRKAENVNGMKDTNVRENGVDTSGLDAEAHHSKSPRKNVPCTETAEDGDSQSYSKRSQQHESFNTAEVRRKEMPASGGACVAGKKGEKRKKESAPPEESVLKKKMKNKKSKLQRKAASKSDRDDRKPKADNCSPLISNSPPNFDFSCPDPDFSDFEKVKAEDCFAASQFWAIFDHIDAMPRSYVLVRNVYSPFKLQITCLHVDSDDRGAFDWQDAGLPVACGKYKLGRSEIVTDRFMFSHQIHCIKGSDRGSYLVYPKKGETWAIFRDWDIGWSSNPGKHSKYEYEYVEVLSDFDENIGIGVSYLGKVKGFVSLFQQTVQNGFRSFCIPPNELYRFSHLIPSYKMTGDEREDVPRGSFELDTLCLPASLFEVGDPGDTNIENGVLNNGVNV